MSSRSHVESSFLSSLGKTQLGEPKPVTEDRVMYMVESERSERARALDSIWQTLERVQAQVVEARDTQHSDSTRKAAAQEKNEMLSAVAAIHGDVEALRKQMKLMQRNYTNQSLMSDGDESDTAQLYARIDAQEQKQEDMRKAFETQVHALQRQLAASNTLSGESTKLSDSDGDLVTAIKAEIGAYNEVTSSQIWDLTTRLDQLTGQTSELRKEELELVHSVQKLKDLQREQEQTLNRSFDCARRAEETTSGMQASLRSEINAIDDALRSALKDEASALRATLATLEKQNNDRLQEQMQSIRREVQKVQSMSEQDSRNIEHLNASFARELPANRAAWQSQVKELTAGLQGQHSATVELRRQLENERNAREHIKDLEREKLAGDIADLRASLRRLMEQVNSASPQETLTTPSSSDGASNTIEFKQLSRSSQDMQTQLGRVEQQMQEMRVWPERMQVLDKNLASLTIELRRVGEECSSLTKSQQKQKKEHDDTNDIVHLKRELETLKKSVTVETTKRSAISRSVSSDLKSAPDFSAMPSIVKDQERNLEELRSAIAAERKSRCEKNNEIMETVHKLQRDVDSESAKRGLAIGEINAQVAQAKAANMKLMEESNADARRLLEKSEGPISRDLSNDFSNRLEQEQNERIRAVDSLKADHKTVMATISDQIMEATQTITDQTNRKIRTVTDQCSDLQRQVQLERERIDSVAKDIGQHQVKHGNEVITMRSDLLSHIDEEKKARIAQNLEIRRLLEKEIHDRTVDSTEQRYEIIKAMREWHQHHTVSDATFADNKDAEHKGSWFGWGKS